MDDDIRAAEREVERTDSATGEGENSMLAMADLNARTARLFEAGETDPLAWKRIVQKWQDVAVDLNVQADEQFTRANRAEREVARLRRIAAAARLVAEDDPWFVFSGMYATWAACWSCGEAYRVTVPPDAREHDHGCAWAALRAACEERDG